MYLAINRHFSHLFSFLLDLNFDFIFQSTDVEYVLSSLKKTIIYVISLFIPPVFVCSHSKHVWFHKWLCHQLIKIHFLRKQCKRSLTTNNITCMQQAELWTSFSLSSVWKITCYLPLLSLMVHDSIEDSLIKAIYQRCTGIQIWQLLLSKKVTYSISILLCKAGTGNLTFDPSWLLTTHSDPSQLWRKISILLCPFWNHSKPWYLTYYLNTYCSCLVRSCTVKTV